MTVFRVCFEASVGHADFVDKKALRFPARLSLSPVIAIDASNAAARPASGPTHLRELGHGKSEQPPRQSGQRVRHQATSNADHTRHCVSMLQSDQNLAIAHEARGYI